MKKSIVVSIGVLFFIVGCAEKEHMAKNVVELAGNIKVTGWSGKQEQIRNPNLQPQPPEPRIVIENPTPTPYVNSEIVDSDGDGVPDNLDRCPNTPENLTVNHYGCPILTTLRINFDKGKWDVKKIYYPKLQKVAEIMKANPKLNIEIDGYTDDTGSAKYNLLLSKKRAEAVKNILVREFGISPTRIVAKGFGEKYPLVPNTNETNRCLNRRVEIVNTSKVNVPPIDKPLRAVAKVKKEKKEVKTVLKEPNLLQKKPVIKPEPKTAVITSKSPYKPAVTTAPPKPKTSELNLPTSFQEKDIKVESFDNESIDSILQQTQQELQKEAVKPVPKTIVKATPTTEEVIQLNDNFAEVNTNSSKKTAKKNTKKTDKSPQQSSSVKK